MSARLKRWRVTVIEWLSHDAMVVAPSEAAAEAVARRLWADNAEQQLFQFRDSGIDGIVVDEVLP